LISSAQCTWLRGWPEASRASKPPSSVTFRPTIASSCLAGHYSRVRRPHKRGRSTSPRFFHAQIHGNYTPTRVKDIQRGRHLSVRSLTKEECMISRVATGTRVWRSVMAAFLAFTVTSLIATTPVAADPDRASWSMSGQGITNWRFQPNESQLNAQNVGSLSPSWVATLAGDISATPAVVDGAVYVPDWGGNVSKLDAKTGA